jgi:hypothetical protein
LIYQFADVYLLIYWSDMANHSLVFGMCILQVNNEWRVFNSIFQQYGISFLSCRSVCWINRSTVGKQPTCHELFHFLKVGKGVSFHAKLNGMKYIFPISCSKFYGTIVRHGGEILSMNLNGLYNGLFCILISNDISKVYGKYIWL